MFPLVASRDATRCPSDARSFPTEMKKEKVWNLIRARITSTRSRGPDRGFPNGQLYACTIIGVWDPGVPLSVFSAPLVGGTPHCNLSELQFALLCSACSRRLPPNPYASPDCTVRSPAFFTLNRNLLIQNISHDTRNKKHEMSGAHGSQTRIK